MRKVYFILTLQIAFTAGFASLFVFYQPAQDWMIRK